MIGAAEDTPLHEKIIADASEARSLAGETSLLELATLCRGAALALGNDTGPMHMAAVAGVPTVVLYSHASDPALCAQRGDRVTILREPSLTDLSAEAVLKAVSDA